MSGNTVRDFDADSSPSRQGADASAAALQQLAQSVSTGYRSISVMAYDIIREAILNGTLAPGQRLRQETLAELIGVSRVPVRSALIQLEADGLVELQERRGAVVTSLSSAQVREIYNIRILLETEAIRLSMTAMTPARLEHLHELARVADAEQEGSSFVDARSDFYAELYDSTGNPILWEMIEQLRLKVGRYVLGQRVVAHGSSHERLAEAADSGDADAATGILRAHIESVRDAVLELLEQEAAQRSSH